MTLGAKRTLKGDAPSPTSPGAQHFASVTGVTRNVATVGEAFGQCVTGTRSATKPGTQGKAELLV